MKEWALFSLLWLPIWWLAQAFLALRDYLRKRSQVARMPPADEAELNAIAAVKAARPGKERKTFRWSIENPGAAIGSSWIYLAVLVFFWPMVVIFLLLPPIAMRLSPEMVARIHAEGLK